jgi:hypothetical protein
LGHKNIKLGAKQMDFYLKNPILALV